MMVVLTNRIEPTSFRENLVRIYPKIQYPLAVVKKKMRKNLD